MPSNEMGKFGEMALFLKNLAPKLCLRHFTVEVWRDSAIKSPTLHVRMVARDKDSIHTGDLGPRRSDYYIRRPWREISQPE